MKALMKSKLGESVTGGGYSDDLKQATFSVGLKGVKKEDVPKVEALIDETLKKIVKEGVEPKSVEATMNSIEFSVREFSSASSNRGLSLYLSALSNWIYERDPIEGLRFGGPLQEIKDNLAKDGQKYLETLIQKYLVDNPHRLTLEGVPDASMSAREEAEEKAKFEKTKESFDKSKIEAVIEETGELKIAQKAVDSAKALATLPKLSIDDLQREEKELDITVGSKEGVPFLTHAVDSAGIVYADLVMDLSKVPVADVPLLPLFMSLLFDVGTSELSPEELTRKIGARTGGIGVTKINALKIGQKGIIGDSNNITPCH